MQLYASKGCGSAIVEMIFARAGVSYERIEVSYETEEGRAILRRFNPLAQVPTLVLDDGTVMTESAGIALWLAERYAKMELLPAEAAQRALCYRWMVYFATNVYGPIIVGDFPDRWVDGADAGESLKTKARQRLEHAWRAFEDSVAPAPFLLGTRMSVLDLYVAMVSRWRPGRAWLLEHCPKAMAAVVQTEAQPVVMAAWARNFG